VFESVKDGKLAAEACDEKREAANKATIAEKT
jgi:hypothetical protein